VTKPGVSNLLTLLAVSTGSSVSALEKEYGSGGYGNFKTAVAEAAVEKLSPIRQRTEELLADPAELDRILAEGSRKATEYALGTLKKVHHAIGLLPEH
jgi:tryptophanyl-tRNA synthetase